HCSNMKKNVEELASIKTYLSTTTNQRVSDLYCGKGDPINLTEEKHQRSVELTHYLKRQIGETSTLSTLGEFLSEIGEYEKAEKFYWMLPEEIPKDDERQGMVYNSLGCLLYEMNSIAAAQHYFEQAIEIMNITNSDPQSILTTCNYEMAYLDSLLHTVTSHAETIELLT
ncbi:unnamed protein product, partial [Didymodactylos carnosus]